MSLARDPPHLLSALALALLVASAAPRAQLDGSAETLDVKGGGCEPSWLPTFAQAPGVDGEILALTVFDDGSGPALYAGGNFITAGGVVVNRVARWDGSGWSALGTGVNDMVWDLIGFDDGHGPALYAAGVFTTAGGLEANYIAKWDGSSWSTLAGGMNGYVTALGVFDDGSGPALYAGGYFTKAGGIAAKRIARWRGSLWVPLPIGINDQGVEALAVHDDGSGPALFIGGSFEGAGGFGANHIVKWDGTTWSALGIGMDNRVEAFAIFDDGSGPALYAGGWFKFAGTTAAGRVAKWDGAKWSKLGSGISSSLVGTGGLVHDLAVFDDGTGPALYAAGDFLLAGGQPANRIAKWDGGSWSTLGDGISGLGSAARDLAIFDGGNGAVLCVGGYFPSAPVSHDGFVAAWGGCPVLPSVWQKLGFALPGAPGTPQLDGTGKLTPGSSATLTLSNAAPSAPCMLFVSLSSAPLPFKCGTLVPASATVQLILSTQGDGSLPVGPAAVPGGLSGLSLYFQYAIVDAGAVCGVALSNALRADFR